MKITNNEQGNFVLEEVYNGVEFITKDGEILGICMRDSGYEFNYEGTWYEAKNGVIKLLCGKSVIEKEHTLERTNEEIKSCPICGGLPDVLGKCLSGCDD